jgi:hypothetical protein
VSNASPELHILCLPPTPFAPPCRKGCIIRLQRHLHELLLDQLPVLRQLARVLDEMSLGIDNAAAAAAAGNGASASRLILEQVCLRCCFGRSETVAKCAAECAICAKGPVASRVLQGMAVLCFLAPASLVELAWH